MTNEVKKKVFEELQKRGYIDTEHTWGMGYWDKWNGLYTEEHSGEGVLENGNTTDPYELEEFVADYVGYNDLLNCIGDLING